MGVCLHCFEYSYKKGIVWGDLLGNESHRYNASEVLKSAFFIVSSPRGLHLEVQTPWAQELLELWGFLGCRILWEGDGI